MDRRHSAYIRLLWLLALLLIAVPSALTLAQQEEEEEEEEESIDFDAPIRMRAAPMAPAAEMSVGGSASVTAGGAQDIGYARQLIESGSIPAANAFTPEGLLSEHDLPVDGPACDRAFCPRMSTGYAPAFDANRNELWVQLGFGSNIDLETFERRPLNVAIVLDRSGSMSGEKMEVVRAAALAMLEDMDEDDRLALVSYASTPEVDLEARIVDDHEPFERIIRGWATSGSTNLEGALEMGYREVARHASEETENRVLVFTDMLPNVGATSPESFRQIAGRWAEEGINLTVLGVGTDFGQGLGLALSELRGGNYYFLGDRDEARRVFGEELAFMVTPVAFDVDMEIVVQPGFELTGVYGVPNPEDEAIETHIATLFLSSRGGAILLRLVPSDTTVASLTPETKIVEVTLHYTRPDHERVEVSTSTSFAMPAVEPDGPIFDQHGPYRAWALVQEALIMREAVELHRSGERDRAQALLTDLAGTLRTVAEETDNEAMEAEVELVEQLATNMR
jgi:Ca-activated chloride channel family protein